MTISELRDKRASLYGTMKDFLDTRRANGTLSAEDDASYAKMEADLNALTAEIRREERREAIDAEMSRPVSAPIVERPMKVADEKLGRASREYRADFLNMLRGKRQMYNVMEEGTDSAGGYLCPEEFEKQIVVGLAQQNVMRKICKVITTNNEHKIPVAATRSTAAWTAESAAYTESDPTFTQKTIDAYKLTDLIKVSLELLQDSMFDLETYIANEIAYAFGVAEESAFCVGNGSGKPTGLFTSAGGTVGVTTASATAITADEVISLIYALKAPYRKNAKFLMNDATVAMLRKLKDGNGVYLWQPALQAGQPDRLMGYEIYTSASVPTVQASAYTVAFGDFQNYWIADRSGRTLQRLNELYSTNGQIGFAATERVDGKIVLAEGIQLIQQHS